MDEPGPMREIHEIRLKIYDRIKEMLPEDQMRYFNESTKETVEKYGIQVGTPAERHRLRKAL